MSLTYPSTLGHRMPAQPTPLLGRDDHLAAAATLLRDDAVRLLTLTGPAGVGKTRLAVALAERLAERFPDGAVFVDLASVRDPDLVIPTIAHALNVREAPGEPLRERLARAVEGRRLLLVLDNFEQVLGAAADVAALLTASPTLTLIATSRVSLRLRWEQEFPVPTLPVPPSQERVDGGRQKSAGQVLSPDPSVAGPDRLLDYAAVRLFVERARAVAPDFRLDGDNAAAVAAICVWLDGLPLAIELAAARSKMLPPAAILSRLERRLDMLSGGAVDLPARQRSLRAATGWSYDLLSPDEQRLFRRLGVFVGSFDLDAAAALWPHPYADMLDLMAHLNDQSLLLADRSRTEPRFRLLQTIRDYALERLLATGELDEMQRRHAAYYLALAEEAEPALLTAEQTVWLDRLETEHDNLRAALRWSLEQQEAETAVRLTGALARFWAVHGHLSEGRRWLEQSLAAPGVVPPRARAKALHGAGFLAWSQGDFAAARALTEGSLALRRASDNAGEIAASLNNLGIIASEQGDFAAARHFYEESLALLRGLGDDARIAVALNNLGNTALALADYEQAAAAYEESLAHSRSRGDTVNIAFALNNLGRLTQHRGDLLTARRLVEEALDLRRQVGDTGGTAVSLHVVALLMLALGEANAAATYLQEGLALVRGLGDKRGLVRYLEAFAALAAAERQFTRAARLLGAADALRGGMHVVTAPIDQREHDRVLAATRSALGEPAFTTAWTEGRACSPEDALRKTERRATANDASSSIPPPAAFSHSLSVREVEVLRLLAGGKTNKEIAAALVVSVRTVESHRANIYTKTGARTRAELVAFARQHGLA